MSLSRAGQDRSVCSATCGNSNPNNTSSWWHGVASKVQLGVARNTTGCAAMVTPTVRPTSRPTVQSPSVRRLTARPRTTTELPKTKKSRLPPPSPSPANSASRAGHPYVAASHVVAPPIKRVKLRLFFLHDGLVALPCRGFLWQRLEASTASPTKGYALQVARACARSAWTLRCAHPQLRRLWDASQNLDGLDAHRQPIPRFPRISTTLVCLKLTVCMVSSTGSTSAKR